MPKYRDSKEKIDQALRKIPEKERGATVKKYIILPGGEVEIETTKHIEELEKK